MIKILLYHSFWLLSAYKYIKKYISLIEYIKGAEINRLIKKENELLVDSLLQEVNVIK